MNYKVQRLTRPPVIDAVWEKAPWTVIDPLVVGRYMGEAPTHRPRTEAKLACDDAAVTVIFRVEDRYVRVAAEAHQAAVCEDSCVEFFFAPWSDVSRGYFNLEMNGGGTMLFHFQVVPRVDHTAVSAADLATVEIAHSLPRIVEPELCEPVTWTVECRLPLAMLEHYAPIERPGPGVQWRANFYKCGDKTSHPHWLTWAAVDRPEPDFHVPASFGVLEF